jgi:lysophospholipase L1-like esterase
MRATWRRTGCAVVLLALGVAGCGGGGGGGGMTGSSGNTRVSGDFDFGNNDARRVSAFGDSITLGELGDVELRPRLRKLFRVTAANYPNDLQGMLRGLDPAWRVVNRGVGGETTSSGVGRFGSVLNADHPGYVLIMEGTNDVDRGTPPSTILANLESMVNQAEANRTVPVLGTIPPNFRNDRNAQALIAQTNPMIRALAQSRRITLAEIFDRMNDRSLFATPQEGVNDPLHPNERGYAVMADIWFDAMQRTTPAGTLSQRRK